LRAALSHQHERIPTVRPQRGQRRAKFKAHHMTFRHEIAVPLGCELSIRIWRPLFRLLKFRVEFIAEDRMLPSDEI
jgi:hypothetical protein